MNTETMNTTPEQRKVIERVQKLLRLARDGGATEAEANLAMDRAQSMMLEHGLEMATIESAGGEGEGREKAQTRGRAHKKWMREVMLALSEAYFVTAVVQEHRDQHGRLRPSWTLIGRVSGVTTVRLMHEYVMKTVSRTVREQSHSGDELFMEGMGTRVADRIRERHRAALEEQRVAAEKQHRAEEERRRSGAASTALVPVLEDYARRERELNQDMLDGLPPGTITARRAAREAADEKKREERRQREKEIERLQSEDGLSFEVAYDIVELGWTRERAEAYEAEVAARAAESKDDSGAARARQRDSARANRECEQWARRQRERAEKELARKSNPSYVRGLRAGETVSLDPQVGGSDPARRRIGEG